MTMEYFSGSAPTGALRQNGQTPPALRSSSSPRLRVARCVRAGLFGGCRGGIPWPLRLVCDTLSPALRSYGRDWCCGFIAAPSRPRSQLPYGTLDDVLSRDQSARNCHTTDKADGWFAVDTGLHIVPTAYTLRHARGYSRSALRNWVFQVRLVTTQSRCPSLSLCYFRTCCWHDANSLMAPPSPLVLRHPATFT